MRGCADIGGPGKNEHVGFVSDVLEQFPSAKPALLAIDANRERRVWHFGELIAMSAGSRARWQPVA